MSHLVNPQMYDGKFATLSRNAQLLELYFRTCRHRNSEGLYWIPLGYIEVDLGMSEEEAARALLELEEHGRRFHYDWEKSIILDLTALRDNPLGRNDKRIPGAISRLKQIDPGTELLKQLWIIASQHSASFAEALMITFPNIEQDIDTRAHEEAWSKGHGEGLHPPNRVESIRRGVRDESESETKASDW